MLTYNKVAHSMQERVTTYHVQFQRTSPLLLDRCSCQDDISCSDAYMLCGYPVPMHVWTLEAEYQSEACQNQPVRALD